MLSAIELFVGLPRMKFTMDGVAPTALPTAVFAKADAAAAISRDRRESGFCAQ